MADAVSIRNTEDFRLTLAASAGKGEIFQLPDGRPALLQLNGNATGASSGEKVIFRAGDQATLRKTTGFKALAGGRAYWDHSENKVHYRRNNDRDFYLGRFTADAESADDNCEVTLGIDPPYDIDLKRTAFLSVLAGTPAAGGFGYPVVHGGTHILELTATNEAQKVDLLSLNGFAKGANAIARYLFRVLNDGAAGSQDISIGLANGTHATDADAITESIFIHLNGGSTTIYAESDDGATEVAATDTTTTYTEGSALAQQVEAWIDMRDPADVQIYVNGSLVLAATTFNVDASTGPWYLLIHVEKSSGTDVYRLAADEAMVWTAEQ